MRKGLILILALLVMTFFAGCGGNDAGETGTGGNANGNEQEHAHGDFEWMGEYEFKAGTYLFHFGACEDETMDVGFVKMGANITDLEHHAAHLMATDKETIQQDSEFEARPDYAYTLEMDKEHGHINFTISEDGSYAIVTEHFPSESNMQIFDADENEIKPVREHEGNLDHQH